MYKLLVFQTNIDGRTKCYVFKFETKEAVQTAAKFFGENKCYCQWVYDYTI